MRFFILSILSLTCLDIAASITDLSPNKAEELEIFVTVNIVENSPESTISFSLGTSQFDTCQIDSVYVALINAVDILDFGGSIAPGKRVYNFQLTPQYLDQTTVGSSCISENSRGSDKGFFLYIGDYVQAS